jgi:CheY-like chemotaxis protein
VELHGGTVRAESRGVGHGSTFSIRLPAVSGGRPEPVAQTMPAPRLRSGITGDLSGVRILVVDDEADGREMIGRLLEVRGATVSLAGSAEDALAALRGSSIDLLVSDIGMPRVDGHELMRRVRELDKGRPAPMPAVALTAFAAEEDAVRAAQAGFWAHLAKPVEPATLYGTVARLLARDRAASGPAEKEARRVDPGSVDSP